MKKIILTILLILSISYVNAQEVKLRKGENIDKLKKGTYYKLPNLIFEKFEGTWIYNNGNEVFKIVIKSKKFYITQIDVYTDNLMGKFDHIKNGENSVHNTKSIPQKMGGNVDDLESGFTIFTFYDNVYDKLGTATFEILENGTARWTLENRKTEIHDKDWKEGFSVPTDVILTKVE